MGVDQEKPRGASVGGECNCSYSVSISKLEVNASSSDELINDTDANISCVSEEGSANPVGRVAATLYDCRPSDCTRIYTSVPEGDLKAAPPEGLHSEHEEYKCCEPGDI